MKNHGGLNCKGDDIVNIARQPKLVMLCGSYKFIDKFKEIEKELVMDGNLTILSPFNHCNNANISKEMCEKLNANHLKKLDVCDELFVINVGGYIGKSTQAEIDYVLAHKDKGVRYLEPIPGDISYEVRVSDKYMMVNDGTFKEQPLLTGQLMGNITISSVTLNELINVIGTKLTEDYRLKSWEITTDECKLELTNGRMSAVLSIYLS